MPRLKLQIKMISEIILFPWFQLQKKKKRKIQKLSEILLIFENFEFRYLSIGSRKKKNTPSKNLCKVFEYEKLYLMLPSRDGRKCRQRGWPGGKSSSKVQSTDKNDTTANFAVDRRQQVDDYSIIVLTFMLTW